MRMTNQFILRGSKPVNFSLSDGTQMNYTSIYLDTPLSDGRGSATAEYKWGDNTNFDKIKDFPYPCDVMVDFELQTTGKKQLTIIHDVKLKPTIKGS